MEIQGKRAAVTGAGGFIGGAVCRRLVGEGCEVVGIDREAVLAGAIEASGARFEPADVTDREALELAFAGIDLVVHTAAYVREWGAMEDFVRVNVGGTRDTLEAADAAGVERVVHISSVVVYGYEDEGDQDESAHLRNCGIPYIDTKSASDRIARRRGAVVVRPGDVYGPGSVPWVLRPAELLLAGRWALPGRGDGIMLPVFVDDLVDAIVRAAERGEPGQAYTVWDGTELTFEQYFIRLARALDTRPPRKLPRPLLRSIGATVEGIAALRRRPPEFGRHGVTLLDRRGKASNRRAREELGWEPQVGLDEGIRRSVDPLRSSALVCR